MKNFLFIIVFFILFGFSTQCVFSQQSEYCDDQLKNQLNAICGSWYSAQSNFEFLGCILYFEYKYRDCQYTDPFCEQPRTYRQISVYYIDIDGVNEQICQYLLQNLFPGYPEFSQVNNIVFEQMWGAANDRAAELQFTNFYNGLPSFQQQNYNCAGTSPNCTLPNIECLKYEVVMSHPTCQKLCYGVRLPFAPQGLPYIFFKAHPCDDEELSCCRKIIQYCMCDGLPKKFIISSSSSLDCSMAEPRQNDCIQVEGYEMHQTPNCVILCP
jgi:hypothetical protein